MMHSMMMTMILMVSELDLQSSMLMMSLQVAAGICANTRCSSIAFAANMGFVLLFMFFVSRVFC